MRRRPSLMDIKSAVAKQDGALPGLLPSQANREEMESLPGFPSVPRSFMVEEKYSEEGRDVVLDDDSADMQPDNKDIRNFTKTIEESKIILNEVRKKRYTFQMRIKSMVVNIIIDEDHFELLTVTKESLHDILAGVSALNETRGDRLLISYMPFIEKPFDINRFYLKKNMS